MKIITTDEWVQRLNTLGREIDEIAASMHSSVWAEQLKTKHAQYRKLAAADTCDVVQLEMEL